MFHQVEEMDDAFQDPPAKMAKKEQTKGEGQKCERGASDASG